uniref:Uncharacterized protein n=1 Tax=Solanum tuberosum TaxID=4113 RepID=M1CUP0_SOLTU
MISSRSSWISSGMIPIKTQVPRINIQHAVDPAEHSRVSAKVASSQSHRNHVAHSMKENTDDVQSTPSEAFPVRMTRSVKRTLEDQFILLSAKKPQISKSKSSSQTEPIDIPDDPSESEKTKKGKNKISSNTHKKQRLRAQITLKNEEIIALRVSHNAAMDQLHVSYGLEHDRLVEEIAKLKEDLAKYEAALEVEKSTNSENLKGLLDFFKYTPQSSSPLTTSSKIP